MPVIVRSLSNDVQTLDSVALQPWATQIRAGSTAALVAAVAAKTIQMDVVDDDNAAAAAAETVAVVTPLTGTSYTVPDNTEIVLVNPAATIAAWTVAMPAGPYNGQRVTMSFKEVITTLTMTAAGTTLRAPLTAAAVGGFATWRYRAADTTWYRVG